MRARSGNEGDSDRKAEKGEEDRPLKVDEVVEREGVRKGEVVALEEELGRGACGSERRTTSARGS